jgi:predicted RNA-binding Zn-ribbon protein involved in translation (DUF1610 family)
LRVTEIIESYRDCLMNHAPVAHCSQCKWQFFITNGEGDYECPECGNVMTFCFERKDNGKFLIEEGRFVATDITGSYDYYG